MKNTAILLAISVVNQSTAFLVPSSPSTHHHHLTTTTTTTTLHSTASTPEQLHLLTSASLCANSESCSIESAELYLREIISVQAGCASAAVAGEEEDVVCSDVGRTSEVVAGLREKIRRGAVKENAAWVSFVSLCALCMYQFISIPNYNLRAHFILHDPLSLSLPFIGRILFLYLHLHTMYTYT